MRSFTILFAALLIAVSASAADRAPLPAADKPDLSKSAAAADASKNSKGSAASAPTAKISIDSAGAAQSNTPAKFDEIEGDARQEKITLIESYLSTIVTMTADFTQNSADGSVGTGKFYLKRPGKMRWQYNLPTPLLLVSDGKLLTYYDPGLDQVSYIGVDDTLAGFLAKREVKLDSASTKLTKLQAESGVKDGLIRATIVQVKKPTEGSMTLEFATQPIELKQIITVDATGNETRVQLTNTKFGEALDDKLFAFVDTRGVNSKRNKKQ